MPASTVGRWIDRTQLGHSLIALCPNVLVAFLFGDLDALKAGLLTIALYIVAIRVAPSLPLLLVYAGMTSILAVAYYLALPSPPLFVLIAAATAFAGAYISRWGEHLKSLGNYGFLVPLYIACEAWDGSDHSGALAPVLDQLQYWPLAFLGVGSVLLIHPGGVSGWKKTDWRPAGIFSFQDRAPADHRAAHMDAICFAALRLCAVALAATYVELFDAPLGNWVIWSAASVIYVDRAAAQSKARDRILGAAIGVALGVALGPLLPQGEITYTIAVLLLMLSLVVLPVYPLAFGTRSFCVTIAAITLTHSFKMGMERVENVVIGALIGLAAHYLLSDWLRPDARKGERM